MDLRELTASDIALDVQSLIGTLWNTLCKHTVPRSDDLTSEQLLGPAVLDLSQANYDFSCHAENIKNYRVINFGDERSLKDEMASYLSRKVYPDYIEKEQVIRTVIKQVFGAQPQPEAEQEGLQEFDDGYLT